MAFNFRTRKLSKLWPCVRIRSLRDRENLSCISLGSRASHNSVEINSQNLNEVEDEAMALAFNTNVLVRQLRLIQFDDFILHVVFRTIHTLKRENSCSSHSVAHIRTLLQYMHAAPLCPIAQKSEPIEPLAVMKQEQSEYLSYAQWHISLTAAVVEHSIRMLEHNRMKKV